MTTETKLTYIIEGAKAPKRRLSDLAYDATRGIGGKTRLTTAEFRKHLAKLKINPDGEFDLVLENGKHIVATANPDSLARTPTTVKVTTPARKTATADKGAPTSKLRTIVIRSIEDVLSPTGQSITVAEIEAMPISERTTAARFERAAVKAFEKAEAENPSHTARPKTSVTDWYDAKGKEAAVTSARHSRALKTENAAEPKTAKPRQRASTKAAEGKKAGTTMATAPSKSAQTPPKPSVSAPPAKTGRKSRKAA